MILSVNVAYWPLVVWSNQSKMLSYNIKSAPKNPTLESLSGRVRILQFNHFLLRSLENMRHLKIKHIVSSCFLGRRMQIFESSNLCTDLPFVLLKWLTHLPKQRPCQEHKLRAVKKAMELNASAGRFQFPAVAHYPVFRSIEWVFQ